jgi:hypothetical protein
MANRAERQEQGGQMSFNVSVSRKYAGDDIRHPLSEGLYYRPLGAQIAFSRFWIAVAEQIELPLISSLTNGVLFIYEDEEDNRAQLEEELIQLESYWNKYLEADLRDQLFVRSSYLHEAISIAQDKHAIILIG